MNIGKMINEFYYLSSFPEDKNPPSGYVLEYVKEYNLRILPAVLKCLPDDFATFFMENYSCCDYECREVTYNPVSRTVQIILTYYCCVGIPHESVVSLTFLDVHPLKMADDDEDYPLPAPVDTPIVSGFTISFSSKNNRTKPKGKRPFRCNILLNNRFYIDMTFASIKFEILNP